MTENASLLPSAFPDEHSLLMSYMPFINDGGLFVHTTLAYELGQLVTLSITFLSATEVHLVEGRVVWITPRGSQGNKPAGVGVQFTGDNKRQICNLIETHLTGKLKSTQATDTM
jgi:type IV pilus assembly protein PilZ